MKVAPSIHIYCQCEVIPKLEFRCIHGSFYQFHCFVQCCCTREDEAHCCRSPCCRCSCFFVHPPTTVHVAVFPASSLDLANFAFAFNFAAFAIMRHSGRPRRLSSHFVGELTVDQKELTDSLGNWTVPLREQSDTTNSQFTACRARQSWNHCTRNSNWQCSLSSSRPPCIISVILVIDVIVGIDISRSGALEPSVVDKPAPLINWCRHARGERGRELSKLGFDVKEGDGNYAGGKAAKCGNPLLLGSTPPPTTEAAARAAARRATSRNNGSSTIAAPAPAMARVRRARRSHDNPCTSLRALSAPVRS
mmetsp:Transcript_64404/g.172365  ORF Transcript_64404/g.172365 Transcript_64404/m.172365 type:complete len:307 (-) Transcript_64404:478-1398(-)